MKYTTDQLELIAIMFKIQFADKTVGDFFPDHWNVLRKQIIIGETQIQTEVSFKYCDINFNHFGKCVFWISVLDQRMFTFDENCKSIHIVDIVKMLSFEDKV